MQPALFCGAGPEKQTLKKGKNQYSSILTLDYFGKSASYLHIPKLAEKYEMTKIPSETILTFHGIGSPPEATPKEDALYWISEHTFANLIPRLKEQAESLGTRLLVTFDDGNKSDILIAAPLLKSHNIEGLFFPCSARVGLDGYLSRADINQLQADGFAIGSHGMNHIALTSLKGNALTAEVINSKRHLEEITRQSIRYLALPFGAYNHSVLKCLKKAGYQTVFSSDTGFSKPNRFLKRRYSYYTGIDFDLNRMVSEYASPTRRIVGAAKQIIKSLR